MRHGRGERLRANARGVKYAAVACGCLFLANCANQKIANQVDPKYGVSASPRVVEDGQPVPKGGGTYRVGKPYVVAGKTYVPQENPNYKAEGTASWYGSDFHGRLTANGEVYDRHTLSAAHPTLPLPSYVRVTNMSNGRSVVVRVNDRGPYHGGRLIDLSQKTSEVLDFRSKGIAKVRVEYVGRAPIDGSDDRRLLATYRENGEPAPAPSSVMVASAKPMIPQAPEVMPSAKSAPSGDIPEPRQRPFDLGLKRGDQVASLPGSSEHMTFSSATRPEAKNALIDVADARPVKANAFGHVPALQSTQGQGAVSGRGLY